MILSEHPRIEFILGDCMDLMRDCKDKQFELAIVDPPYGIGNFVQHDRKYNCDWNETVPSDEYFLELRRTSVVRIVWGANYYNCFESGGGIIWDKRNPHPSMSRCEIASHSGQKKVDYVSIEWHGFRRDGRSDFHPCEKPVALYKWLLKNYAKTGDTILDTHGGSFSSAIACHQMGFDFVGVEKDEEYFNAAVKRFQQYQSQGVLF